MSFTEREPNTQYVLSLSYGKDSIACLGAIEKLNWPLDRIVHAEVWATQDIPADLPPMVEFKAKADEWILQNYGIQVEHICATKNGNKLTYEDIFYRPLTPRSKTWQKWISSQIGNVERERERENYGVRNELQPILQRRTQAGGYAPDSHTPRPEREAEDGVTNSSISSRTRIYGFPMVRGNWCTSHLKRPCFPISGLDEPQT